MILKKNRKGNRRMLDERAFHIKLIHSHITNYLLHQNNIKFVIQIYYIKLKVLILYKLFFWHKIGQILIDYTLNEVHKFWYEQSSFLRDRLRQYRFTSSAFLLPLLIQLSIYLPGADLWGGVGDASKFFYNPTRVVSKI